MTTAARPNIQRLLLGGLAARLVMDRRLRRSREDSHRLDHVHPANFSGRDHRDLGLHVAETTVLP